jgi:hypothetical protein
MPSRAQLSNVATVSPLMSSKTSALPCLWSRRTAWALCRSSINGMIDLQKMLRLTSTPEDRSAYPLSWRPRTPPAGLPNVISISSVLLPEMAWSPRRIVHPFCARHLSLTATGKWSRDS